MSTNDFVYENKLQEKAEELFGKDWVAEDDVEQIEKLLDRFLKFSHINKMFLSYWFFYSHQLNKRYNPAKLLISW